MEVHLLVTIVEWATIVVTMVMIASGLPVCINMYKQKTTTNVPYLLFLISAFVSVLSLQYGITVKNKTLIFINVICVLVWGIYVSVYILVSKSKSGPLLKLLSVVGMFWAHNFYLKSLPQSHVEDTLGGYLIVWCTILYLIPIKDVMQMFQEKSADNCDKPLFFGGTLSAATWCFYGVLVQDVNIYLPCVTALVVSGAKAVLMLLYGPLAGKTATVGPAQANTQPMTDFHKEVYNVSPREGLKKRL